jgi:hypothetical protein
MAESNIKILLCHIHRGIHSRSDLYARSIYTYVHIHFAESPSRIAAVTIQTVFIDGDLMASGVGSIVPSVRRYFYFV